MFCLTRPWFAGNDIKWQPEFRGRLTKGRCPSIKTEKLKTRIPLTNTGKPLKTDLQMKKYEAIVIGTGQAGPALAAQLAGKGKNTAIIERNRFGGTCVNTGCTPTKALVASARAAWVTRHSSEFGVSIKGEPVMDMKKVKVRKDEIVKASAEGLEKWLKGTDHLDVIEGHAKFTGPNNMKVNGEELAAEKIFINVGGRPIVPEPFREMKYLTSSSMMEMDYLPEHLVIVGGSYIGLEFGQMYRRFGSRVTIIEKKSRIIHHEDPDISDEIRKVLEKEGIEFRMDAECIGGEMQGEKVVANVNCNEGEPRVLGSHLLLAVGRKPNTEDLGLGVAGIETDDRGFIRTDDQLQTNVPGIWALGDCNGKGAFTHTAYNDYEIVAANLFDNDPRRVTDRIPTYALFTDPALGRVGMTEAQARESGRKVLKGKLPMSMVARAKEKGQTDGLMKILVDRETKKILGAAVLGPEGDEVIHSITDIMYAGASYKTIQRAVHIHPTVSELIPTMLGSLEEL